MMADKITFFESYFEAVEDLDCETYKECLNTLFNYVFKGIEPESLSPTAKMFWMLTKPHVDVSITRAASGKQGGKANKQTQKAEKQVVDSEKQSADSPKQIASENKADNLDDKHSTSSDEATSEQDASKTEAKPKQILSKTEQNKNKNKNIEKEIEKKKSSQSKAPSAIRHRHGEYNHVLLTDDEYNRLLSEFGTDVTERAIKAVDDYCQQFGRTYKDYNLTIRKWGITAARQPNARSGTTNKFNQFEHHQYDFDALEKELTGG